MYQCSIGNITVRKNYILLTNKQCILMEVLSKTFYARM